MKCAEGPVPGGGREDAADGLSSTVEGEMAHIHDSFRQLVQILSSSGVSEVYTPVTVGPGIAISCAASWMAACPVDGGSVCCREALCNDRSCIVSEARLTRYIIRREYCCNCSFAVRVYRDSRQGWR